jgi:hypothetical protein
MLCLADRGSLSFALWQRARATGAELLWRSKSNHVLPELERHADGSYRSRSTPINTTSADAATPSPCASSSTGSRTRPGPQTTRATGC